VKYKKRERNKVSTCECCNEEDMEKDFSSYGDEEIIHDKKDGKYYLVWEHCRNERDRIEIKCCYMCGRKLDKNS